MSTALTKNLIPGQRERSVRVIEYTSAPMLDATTARAKLETVFSRQIKRCANSSCGRFLMKKVPK